METKQMKEMDFGLNESIGPGSETPQAIAKRAELYFENLLAYSAARVERNESAAVIVESLETVSPNVELLPDGLAPINFLPEEVNRSDSVTAMDAMKAASEQAASSSSPLESTPLISNQHLSVTPVNSVDNRLSDGGEGPKWAEGDLVWALMVGYPWWPAILYKNPETETHFRKLKPNYKTLSYNVEFLGYGERAWVGEKNVIPFDGAAKFEEFKKYKVSVAHAGKRKSDRKTLLRPFEVPPKDKQSWTNGVSVAETLSHMTLAERCAHVESNTSIAIQRRKSLDKQRRISEKLGSSALPGKRKGYKRSMEACDSIIDAVDKREGAGKETPNFKRHKLSERLLNLASSSVMKSGKRTLTLPRNFGSVKDRNNWALNSPNNGASYVDSTESLTSEKKDCGKAPIVQRSTTTQRKEKSTEDGEKENWAGGKNVVDALFGSSGKGPVCFDCQEVSFGASMVSCDNCFRVYHTECLTEEKQEKLYQDVFLCDACASGQPQCQICMKQTEDVCVKCSQFGCKRFYHKKCAKRIDEGEKSPAKRVSESNACPMHACHTCLIGTREKEAGGGELIRCLLCSSTYHKKDDCIPAGCDFLSKTALICPRHLDIKNAAIKPVHINVDWCFSGSCKHGGTLVCCEQCPAAFHTECLGLQSVPEETYLCVGCTEGKRPMFNDLVWAKIGIYRWWPAKVLHPLNVPDNIESKPHSVGEFPVMFLGSHDYQYVSRGRVFAYCAEDSASGNDSSSKNTQKAYKKALEEAAEIIREKKEEETRKKAVDSLSSANEPPLYNLLKENLPFDVGPKVLYKEDPCDCRIEDKFPCRDDCSNAHMQIECDDRCRAKDRCCNKRFQKGENAKVVSFKTDGRGWGLRALEPISQGTFICEYIGELISQKEMKRRWKEKTERNEEKFYFLTLDKDRTIDACNAGNIARFMNHSCQPNCSTQIWQVIDDVRVGLFADKDIEPGEELSFHYNMDSLDAEVKLPCHCGAKRCLGYIGKKQQKYNGNNGESKKPVKQSKKRKPPRHEKLCFRCGDGGSLLCCDKRGCPKVYHLECLDESAPPKGTWFCPWHYCNEKCTKSAEFHCHYCDNSYCQKHKEEKGKIKKDESGHWMCIYHDNENYRSDGEEEDSSMETDRESTEGYRGVTEGGENLTEDGKKLPESKPLPQQPFVRSSESELVNNLTEKENLSTEREEQVAEKKETWIPYIASLEESLGN